MLHFATLQTVYCGYLRKRLSSHLLKRCRVASLFSCSQSRFIFLSFIKCQSDNLFNCNCLICLEVWLDVEFNSEGVS